MQSFSFRDVQRLVGVSYPTLNSWVHHGLIRAFPGPKYRTIDKMGLLLAGMLRALGRRRANLATLRPLCDYVNSHHEEHLRAEVDRGRPYLVGGCGVEPRMVSDGARIAHEDPTILLAIFDIGRSLQRLDEGIEADQQRREEQQDDQQDTDQQEGEADD